MLAARSARRNTSAGLLVSDAEHESGMEVKTGQGYAKIHDGSKYRFCSRACLDQFDASPAAFVNPQGRNT